MWKRFDRFRQAVLSETDVRRRVVDSATAILTVAGATFAYLLHPGSFAHSTIIWYLSGLGVASRVAAELAVG